eukprot:9980387-Prorocentrum_lima.AAC.1
MPPITTPHGEPARQTGGSATREAKASEQGKQKGMVHHKGRPAKPARSPAAHQSLCISELLDHAGAH